MLLCTYTHRLLVLPYRPCFTVIFTGTGTASATSFIHTFTSTSYTTCISTLTTTFTATHLSPQSPSFARATPVRLSASLACSAGLTPSFLLTHAMHAHLSASVPQQGGSNLHWLCKPTLLVTITCTFHISTYTSDLRPTSPPLASALASLTLPRTHTHTPPPRVLATVTSDPRAHSTCRTHPRRLCRHPAWPLPPLPAPQCHHQLTTPSSPPPSMSSHCCLSTRPSPLPCTRRSRPCCPVQSALSCGRP